MVEVWRRGWEKLVEGRDCIYIFSRIDSRRAWSGDSPSCGRRRTRKRFDGMGEGTRFVNQMILREAASMARGTNRERERESDSNKFNFCSRLVGLLQASLTFVSRPLRGPLFPSFAVS